MVRESKSPMRKTGGAQVSVFALQPYGGTAYATARMHVVENSAWRPKTATESMNLWFEYKDLKRSTTASDLHRKLPSGRSRAEKVADDINLVFKANILLFPMDLMEYQAEMIEFTDEIIRLAKLDKAWARHQAWLLPTATQLDGGVLYIDSSAVPKKKLVVETGDAGVDGAWAMIQAWLGDVMPIKQLMPWLTKDEYLRRRRVQEARTAGISEEQAEEWFASGGSQHSLMQGFGSQA